jgi:hypothetical protein
VMSCVMRSEMVKSEAPRMQLTSIEAVTRNAGLYLCWGDKNA